MLHTRNVPAGFSGRVAVVSLPARRSRAPSRARTAVARAGGDNVAQQRAELEDQLKAAVAAEDFSLAAALKKQIDIMRPPPTPLEALQEQLAAAVSDERYEAGTTACTRLLPCMLQAARGGGECGRPRCLCSTQQLEPRAPQRRAPQPTPRPTGAPCRTLRACETRWRSWRRPCDPPSPIAPCSSP